MRTGGVGGFFARERFELTVEVDAPDARSPPAARAAAAVPAPSPPRPVGLDALLAAADAAEGHDTDAAVLSPPAPLAPAARLVPETAPMPAHAADTAATPWVFPQVAPARAAALDAFAPAASTLLVEPDPEPVVASTPLPTVVPVATVPEQRTAPEVEQVTGPVPGPHRPMSTESVAFADLLGPAAAGERPPDPAAGGPRRRAGGAGRLCCRPARGRRPEQPEAVRRGRARTSRAGDASRPSCRPHRAGRPGRPAGRARPARRAARRSCSTAPTASSGPWSPRLHLVLADLPVPTADLTRPGAVVLVVGETSQATAAAAALAARHRLPADAVVDLGAAGAAPTADHVRRELARLRGGSTAAVVVVGTDAVADPAGDPWLASVARSLGADQVVACVDATRKVSDLARWLGGLERLGLPVGALDVHHVRSTGDPAARPRPRACRWSVSTAPAPTPPPGPRCCVGRLLGEGGVR